MPRGWSPGSSDGGRINDPAEIRCDAKCRYSFGAPMAARPAAPTADEPRSPRYRCSAPPSEISSKADPDNFNPGAALERNAEFFERWLENPYGLDR